MKGDGGVISAVLVRRSRKPFECLDGQAEDHTAFIRPGSTYLRLYGSAHGEKPWVLPLCMPCALMSRSEQVVAALAVLNDDDRCDEHGRSALLAWPAGAPDTDSGASAAAVRPAPRPRAPARGRRSSVSGGSYEYAYQCVDDMADGLQIDGGCSAVPPALRVAFRAHLRAVAKAMRAIEWNDSGDGDDNEEKLVRACLTGNDWAEAGRAIVAGIEQSVASSAVVVAELRRLGCAPAGAAKEE